MCHPKNVSEILDLYPMSDFLDARGRFIRVSTHGEESIWYCKDCEHTDVDPYEDTCSYCDEEAV